MKCVFKALPRLIQGRTTTFNSIVTERSFSVANEFSVGSVVSVTHAGRNVTINLKGLPRNGCSTIASKLGFFDYIAIGVGKKDMEIIQSQLELNASGKRNSKRRSSLKQYGSLMNVVSQAKELGKPIGVYGRDRLCDLASFGNAAMGNKSEILQLVSLYLNLGNVLGRFVSA